MKRMVILLSFVVLLCFIFSSCASTYEAHGFDDFRYIGNYNSSVEIDMISGVEELINDTAHVNADYHYHCEEGAFLTHSLERMIYYFEYDDDEAYQTAKDHCINSFKYLGDEACQVYNDYLFYDYFAKRSKDTFYHNDNYPECFKYVAFNDENKAIVIIGIYSHGERTEEVAEDVREWEEFLRKYFFEYYTFE